jgi:hypothetical protein
MLKPEEVKLLNDIQSKANGFRRMKLEPDRLVLGGIQFGILCGLADGGLIREKDNKGREATVTSRFVMGMDVIVADGLNVLTFTFKEIEDGEGVH